MFAAASAQGLLSTDRPHWWRVVDALGIDAAFRNQLLALARRAGAAAGREGLVAAGTVQQAIQLLPYVPNLFVKLGPGGCLVVRLLEPGHGDLQHAASGHDGRVVRRARDGPGTGAGTDVGGVYIRHFPAAPLPAPVDGDGDGGVLGVNGAGDTFLGVLVAEMVVRGHGLEPSVALAQRAAVLTLGCRDAVSERVRALF